ncbi:hypothetical protein M758_9G056100 [Ceratodon purpureus]|nr:hypothetical protein M758_9G056100 [Ceratodon purpureus]
MASSSASAAIRMRNEELERQLAEMESKKSRGVSSSSAAIRLRNEQLERQLAEMESKKSRGVSSSSAAIRLRNEQLERQLAEMESKKSGGLSSASAAIQLRNDELERKLAALELSKGKPGGMSSASAAIHLRNAELERQLAEKESKKTMSSASVAIKLKNEELERRLAEMEKKRPHGTKLENLDERHPFGLRSDPLRSVSTLALSHSRQQKVNARNIKLTQVIKESQEVDLAFLVDATGSMQRFIKEVKKKVPDIAASVKKQWPDLKLRVAFAPYRDYEDFDRDDQETCDFTNDFSGSQSAFVKALSGISAGGGGDDAEDVFSGLERVARLSWKSRTRVLVHIGDAPCHGSEFHSGGSITDEYSAGDKKGRNIGTLLKTLRDDCRILCYLFVHVNSITQKMLTAFKRHAGAGNWIHEEKLGNIDNLVNVVVTVSTNSISQSVRVSDNGPAQVAKFVAVPLQPEEPNWNKILYEEARQIRYRFPNSLEELFQILATNGELDTEEMLDSRVQIARSPFSGDGSIRWPYYAVVHQPPEAPRLMVVKRFKTPLGQDVNKVHAPEAYLEQMEVQTVAAYMAEQFNLELARRSYSGDYKKVEFTQVSIIAVGSGSKTKYYNMERYLQGKWIRYTNNLNYVNTEEYAATLHAFSHWTYDRSKGLLMVTDLQGVKDKDNTFWLCDPAVHCKDVLRYERTRTNFGEPGMKRFIQSHHCNNICQSLGLVRTKNVPMASGTGTQLT